MPVRRLFCSDGPVTVGGARRMRSGVGDPGYSSPTCGSDRPIQSHTPSEFDCRPGHRSSCWGMRLLHCLSLLPVLAASLCSAEQWFRGNTHTHSLWSDGNDFPEMIADWYEKEGYDFLVISDHNILSRGERWMKVADVEKRKKGLGRSVLEKYQARFGKEWVELRERNGVAEVRLKTLEEVRAVLDKDGEFLLIEGEEITDRFEKQEVHTNAVNLQELIKPQHGDSLRATMRNNLLAVEEQAERLKKPIIAHLNHPNFRWSITAEDIAHVLEERFVEVYNGHPGINHLGDPENGKPGDERIWDIANTLRLAKLNGPVIQGLATDDSHTYHGGDVRPGRGWIMVRAKELTADSLVKAIQAGDFHASSGVRLEKVEFNPESRQLQIEIAAAESPDGSEVKFQTRIIGTIRGEEDDPATVGKELAVYEGRSVTHTLSGKEWYVRATITADLPHPRPSFPGQKKQAWTQPVGVNTK